MKMVKITKLESISAEREKELVEKNKKMSPSLYYIETGYETIGRLQRDVIVGQSVVVSGFDNWLVTSVVEEVIEDTDTHMLVRTKNSIYRIEYEQTKA